MEEMKNSTKKVSIEIKKTNHCLRRYAESLVNKAAPEDLTGIQGRIIGCIYDKSNIEGKDIYQRDIEEIFAIRRSTATVMLQTLEKKGYIIKTSVKHDARLKKITLTEKAVAMQEELEPVFAAFEGTAVKGIPAEEVETLIKVLERIRTNIKTAEREEKA